MRLVVDTNVLVSALLTRDGVSARFLAGLANERHVPLVDARILAEYRRVLARPRFGLGPEVVAATLSSLEAAAVSIDAPRLPLRLPDPDDLPFLEVAVAGRAHALVTGNARHFAPLQGAHTVRVASPREALDLMNRE